MRKKQKGEREVFAKIVSLKIHSSLWKMYYMKDIKMVDFIVAYDLSDLLESQAN